MSLSSVVRPFSDAFAQSPERLAARAEAGQPCIGYFCTYTPVELIHACGFLPVRISGDPGGVEKAYALIPDFICPFMKRALEKAMAGEYRHLSGVVQGYTCDVACGMVNVWSENIGGAVYRSLPIPYNDTPDAREYLRAEIDAFVGDMNVAGGQFSLDRLVTSLDLYAAVRHRMLALLADPKGAAAVLSAADLHEVARAGFVTPPETFLSMLETLHDALAGASSGSAVGVPVLVSGSLVEAPGVLDAIDSLGARIVADDLCTGYRNWVPADGEGDDPVARLMDRILSRFPCPSRSRAEDRFPLIMARIRATGARGVIFLLQKFCTPHLADVPALTEMLRAAGVPAMVVEMDESWRIDGQHQTRIEGFIEMLQ
jgi:benzoyl-CoA reductase subunit C